MDGLAEAGNMRATANTRARVAFLSGLIAAIALPVGVGWAVWTYHVHGTPQLKEAYGAIPAAVGLGALAFFLGRGGMRTSWITLGRVGGARLARAGWTLGAAGLYFGVMGLLAVSFYGILLLFQ